MKIQFDTPPSSAQEANGLSVRYAAAKRRVPRWRWYLLLTLVLVPPAYFLARFAASYWWETAPAIVVTEQVVVRAQHPGRVEHAVPAGEQVAAGRPLMELREPARSDPDGALQMPLQMPLPMPMQMQTPAQTAEVARQAAAQAQAQAQAATLSLRQSMLDEALRLAQRQLALQQERLRTMEQLRSQGAATRQEVDNAKFQEIQALSDASKARAGASENRALLASERAAGRTATAIAPSSVPPAPGNAATATAVHAVVSPFAGLVVRQLVRQGEWVQPGADVAVVQAQTEPLVHAYLPPERARYAQVGRQATLHFMDGGQARAEVVGVVAEVERTPSDRVSTLSPRMPSIVVRLRALEPVPAAYRIHQLPLDVSFDWVRPWS